MADSIIGLVQALKSDGAVVKTGQIVSYGAYDAVVNVDGQNISMKLMDHVTAGLNRVVVCAVQGDTGFIIGTLDNTARTPVAADGNATNDSTTVTSTTSGTYSYAPKTVANFATAFGQWASSSTVNQGTGTQGFWFYGSGRFKSLQGKTVTKFQIYIKFTSGSSASVKYHFYGSKPSGTPTVGGTAQGVSGGWITLPTSWADALIAGSGTGGIAATGSTSAAMKGLPDGGTLKISWKK